MSTEELRAEVPGTSTVPMYDDFSVDYDRFVEWEGRLAAEMPFIERELQAAEAHRVLDAACGTGMHAIALAEKGYEVVGTDVSQGMIEEAQANAVDVRVTTRFVKAGFGQLAHTLTPSRRFDAVLCLGNSLPHVLAPADLKTTLVDFAACLRPGGLLLIQNRNFDAVLARRQRWMDPQAYRDDGTEWLFMRFYDFRPDGMLTFNLATLQRHGAGEWQQRVTSTRLWPMKQAELMKALETEGYDNIFCFGDMRGSPFDANNSPNLVVAARHTGG
jgi:ubiquinone/menaquinone biosynthesis C-methylase UbiE